MFYDLKKNSKVLANTPGPNQSQESLRFDEVIAPEALRGQSIRLQLNQTTDSTHV